MSSLTVDEIKKQEEDIFSEECRDLTQVLNKAGGQRARVKALQQLAVSEDSPFNLTGLEAGGGLQRIPSQVSLEEELKLRDEKARQLREETEEIKRQLELVKRHLNEFNQAGCKSLAANGEDKNGRRRDHCDPEGEPAPAEPNPEESLTDSAKNERRNTRRPPREDFGNDQQMTSTDSQFHRLRESSSEVTENSRPAVAKPTRNDERPSEWAARFRPLTGKTDCPNCSCDRRRSVCDKCVELQRDVVQRAAGREWPVGAQTAEITRQPTLLTEQRINRLNDHCPKARSPSRRANSGDYDERPIRPARKKLEDLLDEATSQQPAATRAKVVDQCIVPSSIYTIGKSLNEKRTKLAQAIEDLQIMFDKVKKRGDRLEQERKLAMLYKDQWKFGATIGGGSRSGSRDSLARAPGAQYHSRLDPNLARDVKAMMGFKSVEPALKLRQYDSNRAAPSLARNHQQYQSVPPKPKPRLSKLGISNNRGPTAPGGGNYRKATEASMLHSRSKSLESLPRQRPTMATSAKRQPPKSLPSDGNNQANFHTGKAASVLDLSSPVEPDRDEDGSSSTPDQGVEEDLEEEIREDPEEWDKRPGSTTAGDSRATLECAARDSPDEARGSKSRPPQNDQNENQARSDDTSDESQARRTGGWVPVFGETEIKTISRRPVARKVIALNGSRGNLGTSTRRKPEGESSAAVGRSILRTNVSTVTRPKTAMRTAIAGNDRVLAEAKKKLQFARNLSEREHLDSHTRNQIVIDRQRVAPKSRAQPLRAQPSRSAAAMQMTARQSSDLNQGPYVHRNRQATGLRLAQSNNLSSSATTNGSTSGLIPDEHIEISRLEEMIREQQRMLLQLSSGGDRVTPTCCRLHGLPPCRTTPSPTDPSQSCKSQNQAGKQLVGRLRDRLNKMRSRLAKILEEERAKHQQLEQRFDSSLRKQSDLENENELLRQSLSKCIDTCLRDISSTFESLSDHLSESVGGVEAGDMVALSPNIAQTAPSPTDPPAATPRAPPANAPILANAARFIADNTHLRRMKSHIDTIERQRRDISEELSQERIKSQQLEHDLKQSKLELEQLSETKRRLETKLATSIASCTDSNRAGLSTMQDSGLIEVPPNECQAGDSNSATQAFPVPSTSRQASDKVDPPSEQPVSDSSMATDDPTSMSFSSIDLYRQYIQSMTPDLDAIRRERKMILSEFDNIKRMLSDMDAQHD